MNKWIGSLLLTLLFMRSDQIASFSSISQAVAYAETLDQNNMPDNDSFLNPSFTKVNYHQVSKGFMKYTSWLLELLGLKKQPLWRPADLATAVEKATAQFLIYKKTTPYGLLLEAQPENRFYIFGDLNGAFHSLIRYLSFLKQQGVIEDSLKLIHPSSYLIFNGNAIDKSPYSAETLTLIADLMVKNPGNILYIIGKDETKNYWKNQSFSKELSIKAPALPKESITTFFETLPSAVFIKTEDERFIQISWYNKTYTTSFPLNTKIPPNQLLSVALNETSRPSTLIIDARITGVDRTISYQETNGLEHVASQKGQAVWSVFSSPTLVHKKLYNFHHDAFVELIPAQKFDAWKIVLINRDTQTKEPFKTSSFSLLTEGTSTLTKAPLIFGSTLDLSKTSAPLGKRLQEGIELRFRKQNMQGGVKGHPLKIIFLDDNYTPRRSKQNVELLMTSYGTSTIFCPLGTPTTEAFLPLAEQKKIVILFPCTGAPIFRKPTLTNVINLRASYAREAEALVHYAFTTLRGRKFALFYQDDSYGQGPLYAAQAALKKLGIKDWVETPYLRNNPNIEGAAQKIVNFNPDVILFFSTPGPSGSLIHKLGVNKISTTILMGISFLTDVFRSFLAKKGLNLIMSQVMPNYNNTSIEIIKEYHEDMKKLNPDGKLSADSLEGYINASVLIEILTKMKLPFTQESLIHTIESLKNYPYKGLILNFNPETRELLKNVWIDPGKGENWILSTS